MNEYTILGFWASTGQCILESISGPTAEVAAKYVLYSKGPDLRIVAIVTGVHSQVLVPDKLLSLSNIN